MMGLSLTVEHLVWSFQPGAPPFLQIADLRVDEGKVVAVTGPSGAGKSTLLFLLAGLETPTGGRIQWNRSDGVGFCPSDRDHWRRIHLGLVFQDFQLIPELTAQENVLLPLTFGRFRLGRDERKRASNLLIQLGVSRVTARASTLSRGEMQRTALARALFGHPPVLLADEPTASLDEAHGTDVADLLVGYARQEGATVVVSTHHEALMSRADYQIRLDHGRVSGGRL